MLAYVVWLPAAPVASQPATAPADAEATTRPGDMPACLEAIRSARDSRTAGAAYARGCTLDRGNLALHEAYMRRMLQLARPKVAYFPARTLLARDSRNGLAWGVVGYVHARRNNLAKALAASIMAASKLPDNPSVVGNLAQLLAWHEDQEEPPLLSDAAKRTLSTIRDDLEKTEPFAKAYRKVKDAYAARDKLRDQHQAGISGAMVEAEELLASGRHIDRQVADMQDHIDTFRADIATLRERALYLEDNPDEDPTWQQRRMLYQQINDQQRRVDKLESELRALRRKGEVILGKLKRKLKEVKQLQRAMDRALGKVKIEFRWDPPAVGGVVTPETVRPLTPTTAPGRQAAERLAVAKLYVQNRLPEKARRILNEIIDKYPGTPAAAEARAMLESLKAKRERSSRPTTGRSS